MGPSQQYTSGFTTHQSPKALNTPLYKFAIAFPCLGHGAGFCAAWCFSASSASVKAVTTAAFMPLEIGLGFKKVLGAESGFKTRGFV